MPIKSGEIRRSSQNLNINICLPSESDNVNARGQRSSVCWRCPSWPFLNEKYNSSLFQGKFYPNVFHITFVQTALITVYVIIVLVESFQIYAEVLYDEDEIIFITNIKCHTFSEDWDCKCSIWLNLRYMCLD